MGEHLNKIVNITIYYPNGIPTFMDFVCGRVTEVTVCVDTIDIDESLSGDYFNDRAYKIRFQKWVNQLWLDKDATLTELNNKEFTES